MPSLLKPCSTWDILTDQHYGPATNQVMDAFLPKGNGTTTNPCFLVVHGGGWESGTEDFDTPTALLASTLVRRGFALVSVRYRLTGEAPWPAQIQDVLAAIREVRYRAPSWRIWPDKIGVWGFSAGAHLALMAAVAAADPAYISDTRPGVSNEVACVVADYPPTDLLKWVTTPGFASLDSASSIVGRLLGGRTPSSVPADANRASPAWTGRPIPPTTAAIWLRHGDKDELVPSGQSCAMYDACADAGMGPDRLRYTLEPGLKHADPGFYDLPRMQRVGDWFDGVLRTPDIRH